MSTSKAGTKKLEQKNRKPKPATKKPKKKTGLIAAISITAALLIIGGILAAIYISWSQRQSNIAMIQDAYVSSSNLTKGTFNGAMSIELDTGLYEYESNIKSISLSFDGASDGAKVHGDGAITITTISGEKADIAFDSVMISDGTLFFKVNGVNDALSVLDLPAESAAIVNYLEEFINNIEGNWYKIAIEDVSSYLDSDMKRSFECMVSELQPEVSGNKSGQLADLYRKHPYHTFNKINGKDSKGNTIYDVSIDVDKQASYLNGLKDIGYSDSSISCRTEDLATIEENINFHIDTNSRELRGESMSSVTQGVTTKIEYFAYYAENVNIEIPTNAKPINDILNSINLTDLISPFSAT